MEREEEEKMFIEKLEKRVNEINSLLCVGLDPHPKHVIKIIFSYY